MFILGRQCVGPPGGKKAAINNRCRCVYLGLHGDGINSAASSQLIAESWWFPEPVLTGPSDPSRKYMVNRKIQTRAGNLYTNSKRRYLQLDYSCWICSELIIIRLKRLVTPSL